MTKNRDRYGNHLISAFNQFCSDYQIVPLCISAHSSHLFQPLNVSCFAPLKQLYNYQIEQYMQNGVNYIDKADFLTSYYQAYTETFKSETICNGFKATELVLYNSIQVLSQLHVEMRTPTSPGSSYSSQSSH